MELEKEVTCVYCQQIIVIDGVSRVDSPVMRQLKIDWFKINALKLQAVSHNTTRLIIPASTLERPIPAHLHGQGKQHYIVLNEFC